VRAAARRGQQFTAATRIGGLARREREAYGRASIRGSQMHLSAPASTRSSDGLGSFFERRGRQDAPSRRWSPAPPPRCGRSVRAAVARNRIQHTPLLAHRFIRVQIVCQRPNRFGRPRHLQHFSDTYRIAFSTIRFVSRTRPRCTGNTHLIRSYCATVIPIQRLVLQIFAE
jgi:hypothetical protein